LGTWDCAGHGFHHLARVDHIQSIRLFTLAEDDLPSRELVLVYQVGYVKKLCLGEATEERDSQQPVDNMGAPQPLLYHRKHGQEGPKIAPRDYQQVRIADYRGGRMAGSVVHQ
jgi:hypothetical protein